MYADLFYHTWQWQLRSQPLSAECHCCFYFQEEFRLLPNRQAINTVRSDKWAGFSPANVKRVNRGRWRLVAGGNSLHLTEILSMIMCYKCLPLKSISGIGCHLEMCRCQDLSQVVDEHTLRNECKIKVTVEVQFSGTSLPYLATCLAPTWKHQKITTTMVTSRPSLFIRNIVTKLA